jgi:hypothetical protein
VFQTFRPAIGFITSFCMFSVAAICAAICAALLTGCAPSSETAVDTWKLTPPTLELTNPRGVILKLKASDLRTMEKSASFANESAVLRFSSQDLGLPATFKSRCSSGETETEEFIHDQLTAGSISLMGLLPPLTFAPENLSKEWQCSIKLNVTNGHGSRSGGEIRDLRVDLTALANLASDVNATSLTSKIKLRLICPSWWSDGSSESVDAIARTSIVSGFDTRSFDRQPLCSVMELGTEPKIIGRFRPAFTGARISATETKILIPVAEVPDLYHRKLFSWTIKNEEKFSQTIFIKAPQDSIRLADLLNLPTVNGLTGPVRIFPKFSQTGALEARETSAGYYLRLAAGSSAVVELSSNRIHGITSLADFSRPVGSTHLVVKTDFPISVTALANESGAKQLLLRGTDELDLAPRDLINQKSPVLLNNLILEPNRNTGFLALSKMTFEELNAKPKVNGAWCIMLPIPISLDGRGPPLPVID